MIIESLIYTHAFGIVCLNSLHPNINIYAYSPFFSLCISQCSDKENLFNNQELCFVIVIMSSIQSHDNNDNLGIILQGEISCLSLFGVKGSEKKCWAYDHKKSSFNLV